MSVIVSKAESVVNQTPHHAASASSLQDSASAATRAPIAALPTTLSKDLVRFFKLLADETRLHILYCLMQTDELHVRALCDLLGLSQPAVSHHLGMLRNAQIIEPRRDGKHNFYRILPGNHQQLLAIVFASIPKDNLPLSFGDLNLDHRPAQPR